EAGTADRPRDVAVPAGVPEEEALRVAAAEVVPAQAPDREAARAAGVPDPVAPDPVDPGFGDADFGDPDSGPPAGRDRMVRARAVAPPDRCGAAGPAGCPRVRCRSRTHLQLFSRRVTAHPRHSSCTGHRRTV